MSLGITFSYIAEANVSLSYPAIQPAINKWLCFHQTFLCLSSPRQGTTKFLSFPCSAYISIFDRCSLLRGPEIHYMNIIHRGYIDDLSIIHHWDPLHLVRGLPPGRKVGQLTTATGTVSTTSPLLYWVSEESGTLFRTIYMSYF